MCKLIWTLNRVCDARLLFARRRTRSLMPMGIKIPIKLTFLLLTFANVVVRANGKKATPHRAHASLDVSTHGITRDICLNKCFSSTQNIRWLLLYCSRA